MEKVIFGSDFDGTLAFTGRVPVSNIEAIHQFRKNGGIFCIVSGRTYGVIINELKSQSVNYDFLICNNGAAIFDEKNNELYMNYFDFDCAYRIFDYMNSIPLFSFGMGDGYHVCYPNGNRLYKKSLNEAILTKDMLEKKQICGFFSVYHDHDEMLKAAEGLKQFRNCAEIHISSLRSIDIAPHSISKASALKFIKDRLNIREVYVIGDSINDLPMFYENISMAISAGEEDVKSQAQYIFASVSDALYYVINEKGGFI